MTGAIPWHAESIASLSPEARSRWIREAGEETLKACLFDWRFWARKDQLPPPGSWQTWLLLGGRGSGKTRAGAEWIRAEIEIGRRHRLALIAPSLHDMREVMIEGPSGLKAIAPPNMAPRYESSRRRLIWPNGAVAYGFSAADPDSLRGPQFDGAWVDEFCAWDRPERAWTMLRMGLRLGTDPRAVVTTTPRPMAALKALMSDKGTRISRARTEDNAHLSAMFRETIEAAYGGTQLGRQELEGLWVEDRDGALWTHAMVDAAQKRDAPAAFDRVVVGVDPAVTAHKGSDMTGIVVAGCHGTGRARIWHVLADESCQGMSPDRWANTVQGAYEHHQADCVIAEANQGGDLVRSVLQIAKAHLPVRLVHASRGKRTRAEPVAMLYAHGKVGHQPGLRKLEDALLSFGTSEQAGSPDRVDALVWAITALMDDKPARIRGL